MVRIREKKHPPPGASSTNRSFSYHWHYAESVELKAERGEPSGENYCDSKDL
jgi:hypothetical protein